MDMDEIFQLLKPRQENIFQVSLKTKCCIKNDGLVARIVEETAHPEETLQRVSEVIGYVTEARLEPEMQHLNYIKVNPYGANTLLNGNESHVGDIYVPLKVISHVKKLVFSE